MHDGKEYIPCDLGRARHVAVIQESQGSLMDAEVTRSLCAEVKRLRALNAQLADRLAACSEVLGRMAERDYDRRNKAFRDGQEEMRARVAVACCWWDTETIKRLDKVLDNMVIDDLPSGGAGGGGGGE